MTENKIAKPFLKWAGGKTQLISDIERTLPTDITQKNFTYIEPFVGSGAVLFWMLNNFPNLNPDYALENGYSKFWDRFQREVNHFLRFLMRAILSTICSFTFSKYAPIAKVRKRNVDSLFCVFS